VTLTEQDRTILQHWARVRTTPARLVRGAQIVLLAAEGEENIAIAAELGIDRTIVNRWRRRFAEKELAGIQKDAPRGDRPATRRQQVAATILRVTTQQKPVHATHWSTNSLAKHLERQPFDGRAGQRAQAAPGADLQSNDPQFAEKVVDVVGLPESAGAGVGPARGREEADPGLGPHAAGPADQPPPGSPAPARLSRCTRRTGCRGC
jgi:transposase-like protein